jgi:Xaa-Pro aminopeptidase
MEAVSAVVRGLPHPADFAAPPGAGDLRRWEEADAVARPARLARLRERFAGEGLDAYFGVRPEHMRYLTGFVLEDGEDRVAGQSGRFMISDEGVAVLADSRYRLQAQTQCPGARIEATTYDLAAIWSALARSVGAKRVAVEAGALSHQLWQDLVAAAPDVELVVAPPWVESDRAVKEPTEVERIAAAAAVADRALASIVRRIKPGVSEKTLAMALEWEIRTCGAEGLAFPVACLAGPNAALPHGKPSEAELCAGQVLLFDFGAMVSGYRSDMTRTLFVGEPTARDAGIYDIVARAQQASIDMLTASAKGERSAASGLEADGAARAVIEAAGHGNRFGHGTGHGIGLATHELPTLNRFATEDPLPSPTVFSVEPGIYLDGEMGVRIEDLVLYDTIARRLERLTCFPRDVLVAGV